MADYGKHFLCKECGGFLRASHLGHYDRCDCGNASIEVIGYLVNEVGSAEQISQEEFAHLRDLMNEHRPAVLAVVRRKGNLQ